MPPKAARGAARGRGRGRGKAPPAGEEPPPILPPPRTQAASTSQYGVAAEYTVAASVPEPPNPGITTPHNEFDDADISPNSSPATVPTETPAPTPVRAPLPRSEPSTAASPVRGRGGLGGLRGGRAKITESRFKPKNIRRDATELEELARKEKARLDGLAAEAAKAEARAQRGRGRVMRGRGDTMGRGMGMGRGQGGSASGVFGVVPEALQKKSSILSVKRDGGGGGGGGGGGSSSSARAGPSGPNVIKREGGTNSYGDYTSSGKSRSNDIIPDPEYPGEDTTTARVDIEHINLISDDSDDEPIITGSRPRPNGRKKISSKGGLKPVRLHREEHKERVTLVNTEPAIKVSSDSDEDMPTVDELRSSRAAPKEKSPVAFRNLAEEMRIKDEPELQESGLHLAGSAPPPSSPESKRQAKIGTSSPESKRKTKQNVAEAMQIDDLDDDAAAKAKKDKKGRRPSKKKDKKPVIQTEEDRAEYARHLEDVAILANELGGMQGNLGGQGTDAEGDTALGDAVTEEADKKEGRLYLFQFPPVLPELYNPINGKPKTKAEIKAEKEEQEKAPKTKDTQTSGLSAKAKGKMKEAADPTIVKVEEETILADGSKSPDNKNKREEFVHEEGWIGKLVVRESGKVELCWGGTNLLVGRGVDAGFLTTGVMVDMNERGPPGGGAPEGKALSMGQIMGKFVVTPDWEKMG